MYDFYVGSSFFQGDVCEAQQGFISQRLFTFFFLVIPFGLCTASVVFFVILLLDFFFCISFSKRTAQNATSFFLFLLSVAFCVCCFFDPGEV